MTGRRPARRRRDEPGDRRPRECPAGSWAPRAAFPPVRYVTVEDSPVALTNAERQARYRERRKAGESRVRYRRPADRRSRPQQWNDAVQALLALQDQYRAWRDALPESLAGSATAALLEQVWRSGSVGTGGRRAAQGLRARRLARRPNADSRKTNLQGRRSAPIDALNEPAAGASRYADGFDSRGRLPSPGVPVPFSVTPRDGLAGSGRLPGAPRGPSASST